MPMPLSPFHAVHWPASLPPRYWLAGARVPAALLERTAPGLVALLIDNDRIAAVESRPAGDAPVFDLDGATVYSAFVEPHTHLDKGDLLAAGLAPRQRLYDAIDAVRADYAHWTAAELEARMGFALHEAWAQGTRALNSYCDWSAPDGPLAWEVLQSLRAQWRGRVELVISSIAPVDVLGQGDLARRLAYSVASARGVLGLFAPATREAAQLLPAAFDLAERYDLRLDFHIDEHLDPSVASLPVAARLARERQWGRRTVFGHACAIAQLAPPALDRVLDDLAESGAHLVSLPLTNLHLQDGAVDADRTPRLRGLAPVREAAARGVPVSLGSDNHRDLFHPFGDLDALRTLAVGAIAAHLPQAGHDWAACITSHPARALGLGWDGVLRPGAPADLVLHPGRTSSEVLSRPELGRQVLRDGQRLVADRHDLRALDGVRP